jgi:hypothetical protein
MHPLELVSDVMVDPAIGHTWFEGGPATVYDGLGVELEKSTPTVVAGCLDCHAPIVIDFVPLDSGIVLWHLVTETWVQPVIDAFRLVRRGDAELGSICDGLDLEAHLVTPVCAACSALHAVVLGYGELQPCRYVGTYLGIARARPGQADDG